MFGLSSRRVQLVQQEDNLERLGEDCEDHGWPGPRRIAFADTPSPPSSSYSSPDSALHNKLKNSSTRSSTTCTPNEKFRFLPVPGPSLAPKTCQSIFTQPLNANGEERVTLEMEKPDVWSSSGHTAPSDRSFTDLSRKADVKQARAGSLSTALQGLLNQARSVTTCLATAPIGSRKVEDFEKLPPKFVRPHLQEALKPPSPPPPLATSPELKGNQTEPQAQCPKIKNNNDIKTKSGLQGQGQQDQERVAGRQQGRASLPRSENSPTVLESLRTSEQNSDLTEIQHRESAWTVKSSPRRITALLDDRVKPIRQAMAEISPQPPSEKLPTLSPSSSGSSATTASSLRSSDKTGSGANKARDEPSADAQSSLPTSSQSFAEPARNNTCTSPCLRVPSSEIQVRDRTRCLRSCELAHWHDRRPAAGEGAQLEAAQAHGPDRVVSAWDAVRANSTWDTSSSWATRKQADTPDMDRVRVLDGTPVLHGPPKAQSPDVARTPGAIMITVAQSPALGVQSPDQDQAPSVAAALIRRHVALARCQEEYILNLRERLSKSEAEAMAARAEAVTLRGRLWAVEQQLLARDSVLGPA